MPHLRKKSMRGIQTLFVLLMSFEKENSDKVLPLVGSFDFLYFFPTLLGGKYIFPFGIRLFNCLAYFISPTDQVP